MKKLVSAFAAQLQEALMIGNDYHFVTPVKDFAAVVITGLGGSGIGGSIVQNYLFDKARVPLHVNKDYFLPAFVGEKTLVIVCSYSGNTEETIAAMEQAMAAGATVICITSGGKIAATAQVNGFDCILVPGGHPPRSCVGYSIVQLLFVLRHFSIISGEFEQEIQAAIAQMIAGEDATVAQAHEIATAIFGRLPIIYSAPHYEGVAIRFRQQLNENSKMLCWHAVIPEMNHNELVGWRDDASDKVVILLRNSDDYERTQTRMEINKKVIAQHNARIMEVHSEGSSYWEKALYLIHLTDWVSVILADFRELDATEVKVIDYLKDSLANS